MIAPFCFVFFRSNIFKKVEGFNVNNHVAWDGELMVDFYNAGANFKVIQDFWSGFRIQDQSISGSTQYIKKLNADYCRMRKKYGFPEIGRFKKRIVWFTNWMRQPLTLLQRIYAYVQYVLKLL